MSTNATLSILGLYNYDNTIFDNMALPEGISKDILIDNILVNCAELEVLYTDTDFMKFIIERWSKSQVDKWSKINQYYNIEIDPVNEYDFTRVRTPNLEHSKTGDDTELKTGGESTVKSGSIEETGTDTTTPDLTTTDKVSAYNSGGFENREQTTETGTETKDSENTTTYNNVTDTTTYNNISNKTTYNSKNKETGTDTIRETGHRTDLSKLIESAINLAYNNIYDYIVNEFINRFCLLVY